MTTKRPEKPPAGLKASGLALWSSVADDYELEEHERALLAQAARTVDLLDDLDEVVRREGAMTTGPQGLVAHPAAKESRAQGITLARLLAALRLPTGEEGDEQAGARIRRPQRRSGARGTYGIRGAV